jgi:glycosyltransferase involved in cell wall biosynthesis
LVVYKRMAMHILSIHNRYQIRGGEDESRAAEENLLRQMGHQVDSYEENNDQIAKLSALNLALKTVWSEASRQIVRQTLRQSTYDIVHVQNFFPLISPAVHYAAKAEGVPVIQTLRNYRLLCPNALFFRDGRVCEDCLGKPIPYPGVVHGCYRESQAASAAVATMITAHRVMQTWTHQVDLFIALTQFARQKFIQGGIPAEKIVIKPNFVPFDPGRGEGEGGYALFVGRLSVEKGLDVLLAAWQQLGEKIPLKIVGDGPLSGQVTAAQTSGVEWLGRRPMSEVYDLMGNAKFLVFPSRWYETFGRVAVEAFAKGIPVIAAEIGAIAELVDSGRTGLLYDPNSPADLIAQVEWMLSHPSELTQMRQEARAEFEAKYTAQRNYEYLIDIYDKARSMV